MDIKFIKDNIETLKQMLTGKEGTMRGFHTCAKFSPKPCVLITNKTNVFRYIIEHPELKQGIDALWLGNISLVPKEAIE